MSIILAQISWPCTLHRILSWAFNTRRSNINNMLIQLTNNHFYFFGIPPFFPAKVDFCNVSRPKSDVISVLVIFENFFEFLYIYVYIYNLVWKHVRKELANNLKELFGWLWKIPYFWDLWCWNINCFRTIIVSTAKLSLKSNWQT